jgi:hypothetical protein
MSEVAKIRDMVSEVAPDRARDIMAKYKTVRDGIDLALAAPYSYTATASDAYLNEVTDEMVGLSDESTPEKKRELVESLERNLDSIAEDLGILMDETSMELASVVSIEGILHNTADFLYPLTIDFDVSAELARYDATPDMFKPDLSYLGTFINEMGIVLAGSDDLRAFVYTRKYDLETIIGLLLNGSHKNADNRIADLFARIGCFEKVEKTRLSIGIDSLSNNDVDALIAFWKESGIKLDDALKYVEEIKSTADFKKLKLDAPAMVQLLATGVDMLASGKSREKAVFARMLSIESRFSSKMAEFEGRISENQEEIPDRIAMIGREQKRSGERFTTNIAGIQRNIAINNSNILFLQVKLQVTKAKYALAMGILMKKGTNPASKQTIDLLDKIFRLQKPESLEAFALEHGLKVPSVLAVARVFRVKYDLAVIQTDVEKWIHGDPEVYGNNHARYAYNRLIDEGKMLPRDREKFHEQLNYQLTGMVDLEAVISDQVMTEADYFDKLPYKSFTDVPEDKKTEVSEHAQTYMLALGQLREVTGKLLGVASTAELIWGKLTPPKNNIAINLNDYSFVFGKEGLGEADDSDHMTLDDWGDTTRVMMKGHSKELLAITTFMSNPERAKAFVEAQPSDELMSMSPMMHPLLDIERQKYGAKFDDELKGVEIAAARVIMIPKRIETFYKDPALNRYRMKSPMDTLQEGMELGDKLVLKMVNGRTNLKSLSREIDTALSDHSLYENNPQLKPLREQLLNKAKDTINVYLTDARSPFSLANIAEARTMRPQFQKAYDEKVWQTFKQIGLVVVIVAAAVVTAGAAAAGAGMLFGAAGATTITGGTAIFTVGTGTSFAITTGATALGATVGMRGGMHLSNAIGLSDIDVDWSLYNVDEKTGEVTIGAFTRDFFINWGMSIAIMGVAGRASASIKSMTMADDIALQFRGAVWQSRLGGLRSLTSPVTFREAGKQGVRLAATRTGTEFGQELVETGAEYVPVVGPGLAIAAATINSMDGMNIDTSMIAGKIGAGMTTEGQLVYSSKSATDFVNQLQFRYAGTDLKVDTVINNDGSVDVTLEGLNGPTTLKVQPADVGISPDIEVARIKGLKVDADGTVRLVSETKIGEIATDLVQNKGFRIEPTESGFIAIKGDYRAEIKIEPSIKARMTAKFEAISTKLREVKADAEAYVKNPNSPSLSTKMQFGMMSLGMMLAGVGCSPNPNSLEAASQQMDIAQQSGGSITPYLMAGAGLITLGICVKITKWRGGISFGDIPRLFSQIANIGVGRSLAKADRTLADFLRANPDHDYEGFISETRTDFNEKMTDRQVVKKRGASDRLKADPQMLMTHLKGLEGILNAESKPIIDGEIQPAADAMVEAAQNDDLGAFDTAQEQFQAGVTKLTKLIEGNFTTTFRIKYSHWVAAAVMWSLMLFYGAFGGSSDANPEKQMGAPTGDYDFSGDGLDSKPESGGDLFSPGIESAPQSPPPTDRKPKIEKPEAAPEKKPTQGYTFDPRG